MTKRTKEFKGTRQKQQEGFRIDENWVIYHDANCWALDGTYFGKINPKTGNPVKTHLRTYHTTFQNALKQYIDSTLKLSPDVPDILVRLEKIHTLIDNLKWPER